MRIKVLPLVSLALMPFAGLAQSGGSFDLSWSTIDGGGGTSTGGQFGLSGTAGQPDANHPLTGGSFAFAGGFWSFFNVVQSPGAPLLKIKLSGPEVVLSWPVNTSGFVLEETPTLTSPSWSPTPQATVDTATEHTVTVPATNLVACFRLKHE